jgi:TPR repeat protein
MPFLQLDWLMGSDESDAGADPAEVIASFPARPETGPTLNGTETAQSIEDKEVEAMTRNSIVSVWIAGAVALVIAGSGWAAPVDELRERAEKGDAQAQYDLGLTYDKGDGVPSDPTEAAKWYRKAADQGNAGAQVALGTRYATGRGVPKDYAEALKWYRKAAEQGDALGQLNVGIMYENGEGVAKDYGEAAKWYRKAAERGDALARYNLASMYYGGLGVPKDLVHAYAWASLAAESNPEYEERRDTIASAMTAAEVAMAEKLAGVLRLASGK